jgi:hypothetical protein
MILSAQNCQIKVNLKPTLAIRLVTCKLGTYAEVYSNRYDRPAKNGKLFLIDPKGELVLFTGVNGVFIEKTPEGTIVVHEGEH